MSFRLMNRNRLEQGLLGQADRIGQAAETGDLDFAIRHARANKIGYDDPDKKKFICPCCRMNSTKKDFDFCCSVEELSAVGVGYTLYFKLIMNLKYLMIVLSIFHSSLTFYLNMQGTFCKVYDDPIEALNHNLCEYNIFNVTSLANRVDEEKKTDRQLYIDAVFFYVLMLGLFVIRLNLFFEVIKTKDKRGHAINDFTVHISNLPTMGTARLKVLLERFFANMNLRSGISYEIESVSFCMDIREYNGLLDTKEKLQQRIKKMTSKIAITSKKNQQQQKIDKLEAEHKEVLEKIQAFEEGYELTEHAFTKLFTRKAFVTFRVYGAAHDLLQRYSEEFYTTILWRRIWNYWRGDKGLGKNKLTFEDTELKLMPAVYPSNFIWENAGVGNLEKFTRRSLVLLLEVVLFLVCFYLVTLIAKYQIELRRTMLHESVEESVRSRQYVIMQIVAVSTTFVLVFVNRITAELLRFLVRYEKHEKKTAMDTSIAEKLGLQYFINSSLTLFVVHSYYQNIWKSGGLVYLAAFFMLTNLLAKMAGSYLDAFYMLKYMQKWYYLRNRPKVSQRELNQTFEHNEFDFASNTASILSSCYHCFFYSSMVPIVGVLNIVTQTGEYYLHKWVIIVRCSSKKRFGNDLLVQILNYVDLGLIFYALGTMLTYFIFIEKVPTVYVVNLALSVVYCLLPLNHITRKIITVPKKQLLKRYKDYKSKFDSDNYHQHNPMNLRQYIEMSELSA